MDYPHHEPQLWSHATRQEMDTMFQLCRQDKWLEVYESVRNKPWLATTPMIMDNHIATTIVHQAITSKGNTEMRARVIRQIIKTTPQAAAIKNGYGSLPLHVIAQRNTKMDAQAKEKLIFDLVTAYKGALFEEGGVGKRCPLHIIFTDYISPRLIRMMITNGPQACFMKDKRGFLPAHVACSRHCSPEKLRMLLEVNPQSLWAKTDEGDTLLSLATSTATKSHPNYALIDELNRQLSTTDPHVRPLHTVSSSDASSRGRLDSNDSVQVPHQAPPVVTRSRKRRKAAEMDDPANLLLHFSRHIGEDAKSDDDEREPPMPTAQV